MCLRERTIIYLDEFFFFLFSICFPGCVVLTHNTPCLEKHKVQADPFGSRHLNGFSSSFCQSENISFLNWMKNVCCLTDRY